MRDGRQRSHCFGGSGDIDLLTFLDRVTVWTELKNFQGEKKAVALASRLKGAAFDNYRRLSADAKKTFDTIVQSVKHALFAWRSGSYTSSC